MVTSIRRRMDDQRGFTLIELLVVMIIISILMAVAIPVFLGQKQKALASQQKQNVKHVVDTIESCAAGTTSGQLVEGAVNCTAPARIGQEEASLNSILAGGGCTTPPAGCVTISTQASAGAPDSYALVGTTNNQAAQQVSFQYARGPQVAIKRCANGGAVGIAPPAGTVAPAPVAPGATTAAGRMCSSGAW